MLNCLLNWLKKKAGKKLIRKTLINLVNFSSGGTACSPVSSPKIESIPGKHFVKRSISPWWKPYVCNTTLELTSNGVLVIHKIIAGSDFPILGCVYNLIARSIFLSKKNIEAIEHHAREEFKNMVRIIKGGH